MITTQDFFTQLEQTCLKPWLEDLQTQAEKSIQDSDHGDLPKWQKILESLPAITPSSCDLNQDAVRIGALEDCGQDVRTKLEEQLRAYHPWRKGPFDIFGIHIETEWRSDLKWNRFKEDIQSLKDRVVLDIGCGSGYHLWRMLGAGAKLALGVDPTLLYYMQFQAMQKYIQDHRAAVLPIGLEQLPDGLTGFDTVFSMGILYHRRSPFEHLYQLKNFMRDDGELVLETLVIDGKKGEALVPDGRYARMPNVWFIPSCLTLEGWMKRVGFREIKLLDVNQTTSEEQRVTDWMGFQSLADFLDPKDPGKTVEGYPAPKRAVFTARNAI